MKRLARRYRNLLEQVNLAPMNNIEIIGFHIAFVGTLMWATAAVCAMLVICLMVASTLEYSPGQSQPFANSAWRQASIQTLLNLAIPLSATGTASMAAGILINKAGVKRSAAQRDIDR